LASLEKLGEDIRAASPAISRAGVETAETMRLATAAYSKKLDAASQALDPARLGEALEKRDRSMLEASEALVKAAAALEAAPAKLNAALCATSARLDAALGAAPAKLDAALDDFPAKLDAALVAVPGRIEAALGDGPAKLGATLGRIEAASAALEQAAARRSPEPNRGEQIVNGFHGPQAEFVRRKPEAVEEGRPAMVNGHSDDAPDRKNSGGFFSRFR
jgi:hypothetical protein